MSRCIITLIRTENLIPPNINPTKRKTFGTVLLSKKVKGINMLQYKHQKKTEMIYVCDIIQRRIQGKGLGPNYFQRPETRRAEQIFFGDRPPSPVYLRVWMTTPPLLSQDVIRCRIRDNTADADQHNFIQTNISSSLFSIMHYVEIPQEYQPLTPSPQ